MDSAQPAPGPRVDRWLRVVILIVIGLGAVIIGVRLSQELLGSSPLEGLDGELQQLQTSTGTFVGRVTGERQGFVVLADPATVTTVPAQDDADGEEFFVQMLTADPYGIAGPLIVRVEQVIVAGDVRSDSQLGGAYREASGQGPESSPEP